MKKFLIILTVAVLPLVTSVSAQEGGKIAIVDIVKVFEAHPSTKAATAALTKDREASRADFKEKSNKLKGILQKHQELIRAGKRTEAAEELKNANVIEREIATLRNKGLRDLEEKFRTQKVKIIAEIQKAIASFNADSKYWLILDKSATSSNGLPQVLHAPGAVDITAQVIEHLASNP